MLATTLAIAACTNSSRPVSSAPPAGARYVAMGSSFAAGPGVTRPADRIARCSRSADNYAHQLARSLRLDLTDVSCSGATTAHLLGPWSELPAQIDAVTSETKLVTVTIGGNDVGYIGGLIAASCQFVGGPPPGSPFPRCPEATVASDADWLKLEQSMQTIAREVRRRAPAARLVFVDYLTILPRSQACRETPLQEREASNSRAVARRLAGVTARVAAEMHASLLRASVLSKEHTACGKVPWVTGFPLPQGPGGFVPYHPNEAGMTAVAQALEKILATPKT